MTMFREIANLILIYITNMNANIKMNKEINFYKHVV